MNPEELSEVKSSAYPKLERVPGKQNWVDHAGGLPKYIERIAKHLHYEKGFTISAAIASAVNTVKRWATAGNVTKSGKGAKYQVTAATRAKAAKAVAQWEAKKKSGSAKMKAAKAVKESAEDGRELTPLEEAELLEAISEPEDYAEQIVNDLVRYFNHPRKLAEQMVGNLLTDQDGVSMTPDERENIRGRLATRLALLEGVALSLTGDERTRALAVANAYQILTPGSGSVKLNEARAAVETDEVRWLFAQLDPEVQGLQHAVDALSEAKLSSAERAALPKGAFVFPEERRYPIHDEEHARAALGMVAMHGTPEEVAKVRAAVASRYPKMALKEADTTADYPNLMSGRKCEKCGHSIGKHDKDGKCEDCAKDRAYRAYEMQEAKKKCGCWDGYCRVPGTKRCAPGSCKKCDASRKKGKLSEAHDGSEEDGEIRVMQLQARLGSLGFDTPVDGKFGKDTERRVKEFQMHSGLIQDGVVGPKTTERLQQAPESVDAIAADPGLVPSAVSREKAPEPLDVKDAEDAKKPTGDSTDDEKKSKTAVREGLADGFGSETETGPTIMPDDLNLMNPVEPIQVAPRKDESSFSPPPKPKPLPKPKVKKSVLFKGLGVGEARSNPDVRDAQADLGRLGYNLEVDGRFGPQTEQTVKRFQRKYGLKADGVVGPKTSRTIKGVKKHLEKIDEAALDQELALDAPDWQEARDRLVVLKRELAEAEKKGEAAWPELEVDNLEVEEALRGAAREVVAQLKRLDDGTFAPKGMGRVLVPGDKVDLPQGTGTVKDGNKVEIADGPRKGETVKLKSDDGFADAMRKAGSFLTPPDGYDFTGGGDKLPDGDGWLFRFTKSDELRGREKERDEVWLDDVFVVLLPDGSVARGAGPDEARNDAYAASQRKANGERRAERKKAEKQREGDPDGKFFKDPADKVLTDEDLANAQRRAGNSLKAPEYYDYDVGGEELPDGNGWWFRFIKSDSLRQREEDRDENWAEQTYAVLLKDGSVSRGASIDDAQNEVYAAMQREANAAARRKNKKKKRVEEARGDTDHFKLLIASVEPGGLVETGGYVYKRLGPNKWGLEDGQETLETDDTLAYRLAHDASLAMSDGVKELEDEDSEVADDDEVADDEKKAFDADEEDEDEGDEDKGEDNDEDDGDEMEDNIGPDAKPVRELERGQRMMLTNGEEYVYDRQADPDKPFHIIKPVGWTEDNDLKAKPMHGEIVPPKIGKRPQKSAMEAYLEAGGDDPVVIDALRLAESTQTSLEDVLDVVEELTNDL